MLTVFCSPLRYVQGIDATERLGDEMLAVGLGGPVLVVAGTHAVARLAPPWARSFASAGFAHRVRGFGGECSRGEIAAITNEARSLSARTIVAAGGGKVIDAGRAAAAALGLPFVSCPTVCSTDAPTSALSVIYAESPTGHGAVEGYEIHRRSPDLVLVDSRVIAESPPRTLAAGIGDALSTYYEARAAIASGRANMRGGRATLAAMALATLCRDTILADAPTALADCRRREPTPALERTIEAATLLSGLGFESAGLAAAHAIHNGLATLHALHGEKVAFGTLAQLMLEADAPPSSPLDPRRSHDEAVALARFLRLVGLPCTLGDLGVADEHFEAMIAAVAERSVRPEETIHAMPFPVDAAAVARALRAADRLGRNTPA